MAVTGGEKRDPEPASHIPESSPNPEGTTPEQEARREFGERLRGLLQAYKDTLNTVKDLPVVVWVPWDRKGVGRYFKVPICDGFLRTSSYTTLVGAWTPSTAASLRALLSPATPTPTGRTARP